MNQKMIDEIWARCEAATPGSWKKLKRNNKSNLYDIGGCPDSQWDGTEYTMVATCLKQNDADLIVNAPDYIRYLLNQNKRLQSENAELRARFDKAVELPTPDDIGERLCDFCKCSPEYRGIHLGPNGLYGCEGSWCGEAYERFIEGVEDLIGVSFREQAESALKGLTDNDA